MLPRYARSQPDDTTATWMMDEMGTEERLLRRQATNFCTEEPCVLHISVYGCEAVLLAGCGRFLNLRLLAC